MVEACHAATAIRASSSACSSAKAGGTAATRSASTETDGRLRALGRAADRGVDRQARQGPRARARRVARTGPTGSAARSELADPYELGGEFFRWEFAVAVAGSILGINPFDQPDVQAAKDKTNEVLAAGDERARARGLARRAVRAAPSRPTTSAIQAFIDPSAGARAAAADRARPAHETGCVVTHGLGPRYLHSTGQLHKGGPHTGLFLQVVDDPGEELPIPGQDLRLRAADPRPGGRRLRIAAGARPRGSSRSPASEEVD